MNINIEITKPLHKEFNLQVKLFHASNAIVYCTKNTGQHETVCICGPSIVNLSEINETYLLLVEGSTLGLGNLFATTFGNSNLNITILVF